MKCMMRRWSVLMISIVCGTFFVQTSVAVDWYVALDGTGLGVGGWANATNDLQGAIDACVNGNTVWVSNGVYQTGGRPVGSSALTNRVVISKPITVRSLSNNPADTVIKGNKGSDSLGNGPEAVRCVYMSSGACLIGFTVTNGATLSRNGNENAGDSHRGGGIHTSYSNRPVISNCVIVANSASGQGGGVYVGEVYDSVIVGNSVPEGISSYVQAAGGGTCNSTLFDCLLTDNSGDYGSAVSRGTGTRCRIFSNKSSVFALYDSTLYNCLIVSNKTTYAVRDGTLYNCTVAHNDGYGLYHEAQAINCIIYNNKSGNYDRLKKPMAYCCTTPAQDSWVTGDGNITDEPLFMNAAAGDYRLNRDSPCINVGTNGIWTTDSFDLDGFRRTDKITGLVDMGCYEYVFPPFGSILTIR